MPCATPRPHCPAPAPRRPAPARAPALALALAWHLLASSPPCTAAAPPPRTGPAPAELARWVRELGDDDFNVRENASRSLRDAGQVAEPILEKAAASDDREVSRRARGILADFRWGLFPDTPEKVVDLIKAYQSAGRGEKGKVVRQLIGTGRPGWKALTRIARAEDDPQTRKEVFALLSADLSRAVPVMLAEGDYPGLEGLLALALDGDPRAGIANYVAYAVLRGKLDERIAHHLARARANPAARVEHEILTHLYRARGDRALALAAAKDAERPDLVEGLLYEAGDWKALAARPELASATDPVEKLGLRAAYHRLAGQEKEYAAAIAEIRKLADDGLTEAESPLALQLGKALFLNNRPRLALETLQKTRQNDVMCLELHLARHDLAAARALVEEVRKGNHPGRDEAALVWARTRHALGEKAEALKVFKDYGDRIKKGVDAGWFQDLVDAESRCGLADLAWEHAGRVVAASDDEGWPRRLLEKLLADRADEATAVFYLLRTGTPPDKALARVRALFEGKATAKDLDELVALAGKERGGRPLEAPGLLWQAAGEAAAAGKHEEKARECFARADNAAGLIRLGDLLAEKKEWAKAADAYDRAHARAVAQQSDGVVEGDGKASPSLALYLAARAAEQAGDPAGARRRRERAHWLPLGSGYDRSELMRGLIRRDLRDDMRREARLLLRTGEVALHDPASFVRAEAERVLAVDAAARKEHAAAAEGYEQSVLRVMRPTVNFARPVAYVAVPAFIQRQRAQALLDAGKVNEAIEEAGRCLETLPGHIEVVLGLVPELDRRGRAKDAERLYRTCRDVYERVLADHPGSAWAQNSSAWLSACCKRDLPQALERARKGVELSPVAGHHDTLAEVLFQLGRKDEAIKAQKKAVELDPRRAYFRKQLARIEAGDTKAPRPLEEDE